MKVRQVIELSRTSDLPSDGWFQSCLYCDQITARLYYYKTIEKKQTILEYQVFLCPPCQEKVSESAFKKKLHQQCEKRIAALLRTGRTKTTTTTPRPIKSSYQSNLKRR